MNCLRYYIYCILHEVQSSASTVVSMEKERKICIIKIQFISKYKLKSQQFVKQNCYLRAIGIYQSNITNITLSASSMYIQIKHKTGICLFINQLYFIFASHFKHYSQLVLNMYCMYNVQGSTPQAKGFANYVQCFCNHFKVFDDLVAHGGYLVSTVQ